MKFLSRSILFGVVLLFLHGISLSQKETAHSEPKIVRLSFPLYPTKAVALSIAGEVKIKLRIDIKGELSGTEVLIGNALLVQAVRESLSDVKFQPAVSEQEFVLTYIFAIVPSSVDPKVKAKIRFEPPSKIFVFEDQIVASEGLPSEQNRPKN